MNILKNHQPTAGQKFFWSFFNFVVFFLNEKKNFFEEKKKPPPQKKKNKTKTKKKKPLFLLPLKMTPAPGIPFKFFPSRLPKKKPPKKTLFFGCRPSFQNTCFFFLSPYFFFPATHQSPLLFTKTENFFFSGSPESSKPGNPGPNPQTNLVHPAKPYFFFFFLNCFIFFFPFLFFFKKKPENPTKKLEKKNFDFYFEHTNPPPSPLFFPPGFFKSPQKKLRNLKKGALFPIEKIHN